MRPLTLLILVLVAGAALLFAFVSISGDRGGQGTTNGRKVVRPAEDAPAAEPLVAPREAVATKTAVDVQPERAAVETAAGEKVAAIGSILGTVVDAEDKPIPEATVHLLDVRSSTIIEAVHLVSDKDAPEPVDEVVTDETGTFEFVGLKPGKWTLVVTHESYDRYEGNGIVVPEYDTVEERIVLRHGLAISGYVYDAVSNAPVEGATLVLDNPLAAFMPRKRRSMGRLEATTDVYGFFGFKQAGGGNKTLIISAPGYATQVHTNFGMTWGNENLGQKKGGAQVFRRNMRKQGIAEAKEPREVNFELQPGKIIAGRVVGPDGAGVPGAEILASFQSASLGSRGTTTSDAKGEFLVEDIAEGTYTLQAEAAGYTSTPVHGIETETTDNVIRLIERGSVSGKVVVAATRKPATSFTVKIRALHTENPSWGNVVARKQFHDRSKGDFSLEGIPQGDYVAEAIARGFASSFSQPFTVTEGQETSGVVVRLTEGGTIQGIVVDSSGNPVPGATVQTQDNNFVDSEFFAMISTLSPSATTKTTVTADENGAFEVKLMTPDIYQLKISKKGFSSQTINDIAVGDGSVYDAGSVTLSQGAVVKGKVFGHDGKPASGATVWMQPTDNNPWGSKEARTDAKGNFVLESAAAGTYKLSASRGESERGNPFSAISDMQNSEVEITVYDGQTFEQDLHMASVRREQ